MIKEALQYLVGLGEARVQEIEGSQWSDKKMHRIDEYIPKAEPLRLHTLTGLLDYIEENIDTMSERMVIEVQSPTEVLLYSNLNKRREREYLVEVNAMVPHFGFGLYMEQEQFCVGLQSKFRDNKDRALLLKFAGTVEDGTIAQYADDGVSQKATVKTGIASKGDAVLPSPALLIPYRTFLEVEQPESEFVFRMRQGHGGVECAIFEADGGAWQIDAMRFIKSYLEKRLENQERFTVIA